YRVWLAASGSQPLLGAGLVLDGEYTDAFPSGDGKAGGDFLSEFFVRLPPPPEEPPKPEPIKIAITPKVIPTEDPPEESSSATASAAPTPPAPTPPVESRPKPKPPRKRPPRENPQPTPLPPIAEALP